MTEPIKKPNSVAKADALAPQPAPPLVDNLWQTIYDAAANEGSILHDDTVSAIERAIEARLAALHAELEAERQNACPGCGVRDGGWPCGVCFYGHSAAIDSTMPKTTPGEVVQDLLDQLGQMNARAIAAEAEVARLTAALGEARSTR